MTPRCWLAAMLVACLSQAAHAEPSRGFLQELGLIAPPGTLYLDLYNTTGTWTRAADSQMRLSRAGGEVVVALERIGYKTLLQPRLAAYGHLGINTAADSLSYNVGAAYSTHPGTLLVNLNPELVRGAAGTDLYVNAALYLPLQTGLDLGRLSMGAELSLSDNTATRTGLAGGLRWLLRDIVTIDLILAGDGGSGGKASAATPAALRINVRI